MSGRFSDLFLLIDDTFPEISLQWFILHHGFNEIYSCGTVSDSHRIPFSAILTAKVFNILGITKFEVK